MTAIVILVAALVVLTIFGGGITNISNIADFENICKIKAEQTCSLLGTVPIDWTLTTTINGQDVSCSSLVGDCGNLGYETPVTNKHPSKYEEERNIVHETVRG